MQLKRRCKGNYTLVVSVECYIYNARLKVFLQDDLNLPQVKKHKETLENQFVLSINNLQTQLQSIIARINLCKQDLSLYNIEKHSEDVDNTRSNVDLQNEMNELLKHFSRIKSELEESIKNWESSNSLLIKLIEKMNKERDPKRVPHQLPSTSTGMIIFLINVKLILFVTQNSSTNPPLSPWKDLKKKHKISAKKCTKGLQEAKPKKMRQKEG